MLLAIGSGGALLGMSMPAPGATLTWNTTASATWDFSAANWVGPVAWSSNTDSALFPLSGGTSPTITVGSAQQVGAAGIAFTGTTSGTWTFAGGSLQLGASGITDSLGNGIINFNDNISLTASQIWSSSTTSSTSNGGNLVVNGVLGGGSAGSPTNLTLNGDGIVSATVTANASQRVIFDLAAADTFVGSTTVTGGAALRLDYTNATLASRLNGNALTFAGGSVDVAISSGQTNAFTESLASTNITSGANTVFAGSAFGSGNITLALGAINRTGGTIDFPSATTTTSTANTAGILGGWATTAGNTRFAINNGTGLIAGVSGGGSQSNPSSWTSTTNARYNGGLTSYGSSTVNSLAITLSGDPTLTLNNGALLTINSGGLIGGLAGASLTGGSVTTDYSTGELFVYSPIQFTVASAIVDNGGLHTTLVKGGTSTLLLTGSNTYSGGTQILAGTLQTGATNTLSTGAVTINSATLDLGGFSQSIAGLNSAANTNPTDFVTNSGVSSPAILTTTGTGSFGGLIQNGASSTGLVVTGGTQTLTAANTYTGNTTVSTGGTLALTGAGSIANSAVINLMGGGFDVSGTTSIYSVGSSQTLKGQGIVTGPLTINGTLSLGQTNNTAGATQSTLTITGNTTLASSSINNFDLIAAAGSTDLLEIGSSGSGALTINSGATFNINNPNGIAFAGGQVYDLLQFGSESGTGTLSNITLNLPTLSGSLKWDTSNLLTNGTIDVSTVPEPAATGLLALGALLLRRRKRGPRVFDDLLRG